MRFLVFEDAAGGWRWRLVARNGRTVADSAEAYVDRRGAVRAASTVRSLVVKAPIEMEG